MSKATAVAVLIACMLCPSVAQTPRPAFEVAVIKPNKSGDGGGTSGVLPSGQFSVRDRSLLFLIQLAYNVRTDAISGAPGWLDNDHYDVVGKAPPNTPLDTLRHMLQTLLAENFKLATHTEEKLVDVFALLPTKDGPKQLKRSESQRTDCKRSAPESELHVQCTGIGMGDLALNLVGWSQGTIDRRVTDLTNLDGKYDFELVWTPPAIIEEKGGLTIFDALARQLGLNLEPRKVPMPVLVIDHVERLAEN